MSDYFETDGWRPIAELPIGVIAIGGILENGDEVGLIVDAMIHRRADRKVYGVRSYQECVATHFHLPPSPLCIKKQENAA